MVATLAPVLALHLRNAQVLSAHGGLAALAYCLLSLVFSLMAFVAFRIDGAIPRYWAVNDLVDLTFAVLAAELLTCVVLFSFTRLDGIPRSVPAIHALILGAGLLAVRGFVRFTDGRRTRSSSSTVRPEHLIVVGLNDLSVAFMKFLEATGRGERKVVGLLDENPRWFGRSVKGVRVFGPPTHLEALIREFATHGVEVSDVVIDVEGAALSEASLQEVRRVCADEHIGLLSVPQLYTPNGVKASRSSASIPNVRPAVAIVPSAYFRCRRAIDFIAALGLIIAFLPLGVFGALIALLDVGTPIFFWQQRTGMGGRTIELYKLRTLRPAFDQEGRELSEDQRRSRLGQFLRQTRLDELPQLLNVLVGDMALIGPRPLLPQDQPPNPQARLTVRPGITGWAQVNGGTLLSPLEKDTLDSWYISNASLWIDLRIIALTFMSISRGDRRSEEALRRARSIASWQVQVSPRFIGGAAVPSADDKGRSAVRPL